MKARLYGKWPMSQSGPRLAKYRIKNETANKVGVMDKAEDVIGGIFSRSHQRYSPWWRRWELVENTMLHGGEHNVTGHRLRRDHYPRSNLCRLARCRSPRNTGNAILQANSSNLT